MLVDLNGPADHAGVVLKMRVPVTVREDDIGSAIRAVLIGGMEETAEIWLDFEYVKVIAAGFDDPGARRIGARVQARHGDAESRQGLEAAVAVADVEIVGI